MIPIRPQRNVIRLGVLFLSTLLKLMPYFLRLPLSLRPIGRPPWIEIVDDLLVDFLVSSGSDRSDDSRHCFPIHLFRGNSRGLR